MKIIRSVVVLGFAGAMVFAHQVPDDPVLKARTQRALAQGISEGDLPPVPRAIAEPPPLPAPETNYKDTRKGRTSRAARASHGKKGRHHTKGHGTPKSGKKKHR